MNSSPSARIPQLDGLRGIAILLVIAWHYNRLPLSWSGVDLFFVLSGFLLGGILIDRRGASNYFQVFYSRRVLRIFPIYFLWLLLYLLTAAIFATVAPSSSLEPIFSYAGDPRPGGLIPYATFTQNLVMAFSGSMGGHWLNPSWSLAVEEQFYLVLPLLVFLVPPSRLVFPTTALIVSAPLFRFLQFSLFHSTIANYVLLPSRLDSLLLGVLCALAIRTPSAFCRLQQHRDFLGLGALSMIGVALLIFGSKGPESAAELTLGLSVIALSYSALLLYVLTGSAGGIQRITGWRPLRETGIMAYGLYLFHQPVIGVFVVLSSLQGQAPAWGVNSIAFAVTLALAYCSWRWFESRLVALGHRFAYTSCPYLSTPSTASPSSSPSD